MRPHLSLLALATLAHHTFCQLKFGGSTSGGSSSSSSKSTRPAPSTGAPGDKDADTKFLFGTDPGSITGSSAIDGGIVGLGLGALGAAVLGPTIQGVLGGGQQSAGFSACGRRKRLADNEPGERFFLPTGGSCTCNDIN